MYGLQHCLINTYVAAPRVSQLEGEALLFHRMFALLRGKGGAVPGCHFFQVPLALLHLSLEGVHSPLALRLGVVEAFLQTHDLQHVPEEERGQWTQQQ